MTSALVDQRPRADAVFRHEALFYLGDDGFVNGLVPFLAEAVERLEMALVVVSARRVALLRGAMGGGHEQVQYADMAEVGRNPARIIPAWRSFLDEHARSGRPVRGVGEPIWAGRTPAELIECQRHESLLNVAFAGAPAWQLLCPYDVGSLEPAVLAEAARSHPYLYDGGRSERSEAFRGEDSRQAHADAPLPEPGRCLETLEFSAGQLRIVRMVTAARAEQYGMTADNLDSFVLAVHEVAANSLVHGGGSGGYRLWREGRS